MNLSMIAQKMSILEPMNLHDSLEFDELLRQRIKCGWSCSPSDIEAWRADIDTQTMSMFWIVPRSLAPLSFPQRQAGHISMRSMTEPSSNDTGELTSGNLCVRHISNLFILPEHRRSGLGRAAVQALEVEAMSEPYGSPECKAVTLNAVSRQYIEDDGEEWRGMYLRLCSRLGIDEPIKGSSNEDWYARMGYIKYGEQPMYPVSLDNRNFLLIAALLRKELVQEG